MRVAKQKKGAKQKGWGGKTRRKQQGDGGKENGGRGCDQKVVSSTQGTWQTKARWQEESSCASNRAIPDHARSERQYNYIYHLGMRWKSELDR
jgi:hypothetical protein